MSDDGYIYLYCICKKRDLDLSQHGLKKNPLFIIDHKNIEAIVSKIDDLIIDPVDENVFQHEEVVLSIFNQTTIIPMSFGNVFKSKSDVDILMKRIYSQVNNLLPMFKDKVELEVKIFWDPDQVIEEIAKENPHLRRQNKKNIYNQLNIGKEIAMFIENKKQRYLSPILDKLKPLCISYKENRLINNKMILNGSFLVEKEREKKFDLVMDEIYLNSKSRLKIKYNGPWPPYNFVNIKIEIK